MNKRDCERFMSFVDVLPNGCWYWMGARSKGKGNKKTYGTFNYQGRRVRAHVFAHDKLAGKECPAGHHRDHTCCFSMCVNPAHLEAVTRSENQKRKMLRKKCGQEQDIASRLQSATSIKYWAGSLRSDQHMLLSAIV